MAPSGEIPIRLHDPLKKARLKSDRLERPEVLSGWDWLREMTSDSNDIRWDWLKEMTSSDPNDIR